MRDIKIVYIVGETRSGTTLVDRILGSPSEVLSLCELSYVWAAGFEMDDVCSCGTPFSGCEFWTAVRAVLGADDEAVKQVSRLEQDVIRSRYFPLLYSGLLTPRIAKSLDEYTQWLGRLLDAIVEVSGKRIFIDSSKYPSGPLVMARVPGVEVHVLHVVRDLRGFVYSMQKGNRNPGYGGRMAVRGPVSSATGWITRNVFCEMLGRRFPYSRLIYDHCVQSPRTRFTAASKAIGPLRDHPPEFASESEIALPPIHTISGNPHRFDNGPTAIRVDDAWRDKLGASQRSLVTLLGLPLLMRYGLLK